MRLLFKGSGPWLLTFWGNFLIKTWVELVLESTSLPLMYNVSNGISKDLEIQSANFISAWTFGCAWFWWQRKEFPLFSTLYSDPLSIMLWNLTHHNETHCTTQMLVYPTGIAASQIFSEIKRNYSIREGNSFLAHIYNVLFFCDFRFWFRSLG